LRKTEYIEVVAVMNNLLKASSGQGGLF